MANADGVTKGDNKREGVCFFVMVFQQYGIIENIIDFSHKTENKSRSTYIVVVSRLIHYKPPPSPAPAKPLAVPPAPPAPPPRAAAGAAAAEIAPRGGVRGR